MTKMRWTPVTCPQKKVLFPTKIPLPPCVPTHSLKD